MKIKYVDELRISFKIIVLNVVVNICNYYFNYVESVEKIFRNW